MYTLPPTAAQIEELRDIRDAICEEISNMPEWKRGSRWHLDRLEQIQGINRQLQMD